MDIIRAIEQQQIREDLPQFNVGDTVKVHYKIIEGTRERTQVFQGVVIRRHGAGNRETFTVRKISLRRRRRAYVPGALAQDRQDRGPEPRQGPPQQALLPPRQGRQGRPSQGEGLLGRRHARTHVDATPERGCCHRRRLVRAFPAQEPADMSPRDARTVAEIRDAARSLDRVARLQRLADGARRRRPRGRARRSLPRVARERARRRRARATATAVRARAPAARRRATWSSPESTRSAAARSPAR